ncbi:hypothetical protein [Kribbella pratensis]|uniref:tRNA nuclease CdiA C-terminal domain-containing protein n=1 Tax=Kribbella pratensis TaxID=2512112 RepID=A0A4R8CPF1_9ACTN|nr:hypothetical protein [Kribbella pratensis]TDW78011.1 hypothetical protein EV653_3200 [Kribbella pratensis]
MPSELQRVARGLVDCFDEIPRVVEQLQRTAVRCRENAQLALIASRGQATVAAQQLDAAARACEAAAHYLSMAPPKARGWAEGLVGTAGPSTNRPSSDSADRNKATGGSGDLDSLGRTKRLSFSYEDLEVAEDNEPPLVTVARKAFEKYRKAHENDDRDEQEPLEVEITVLETGELEFEERNEKEDQKRNEHLLDDFDIEVDLTEPIKALLASMAATADHQWQHATLTITTDELKATFDYPEEDRPQPIIVNIELPELPEVEFDPAFDLQPLEVDFAPGVHDPDTVFKPHERATADRLAQEGWRIDVRKPDHSSGEKNPDATVRKGRAERGVIVEFKTPSKNSNSTVRRNICDASGQASEIVIDGRNIELSEADAWRAYRRALGQPGKTIADVVHIILGDGRLVTYRKEH